MYPHVSSDIERGTKRRPEPGTKENPHLTYLKWATVVGYGGGGGVGEAKGGSIGGGETDGEANRRNCNLSTVSDRNTKVSGVR